MTQPYLEVITGGMFAGKSTELISKGERHARAGKNVVYSKPKEENRFSADHIVTHSGIKVKAITLDPTYFMLFVHEWITLHEADVILIDEAQFFDETIAGVIQSLLSAGKTVYVAGLDIDFKGNPFPIMAVLMGIADKVTKLKAVCKQCGHDAYASARLTSSTETVELGGNESYAPLCRNCFAEFNEQNTEENV